MNHADVEPFLIDAQAAGTIAENVWPPCNPLTRGDFQTLGTDSGIEHGFRTVHDLHRTRLNMDLLFRSLSRHIRALRAGVRECASPVPNGDLGPISSFDLQPTKNAQEKKGACAPGPYITLL